MNSFDVLRDSLYFFKRNLGQIVQLCLPLVILEAFLQQLVDTTAGPDGFPGDSTIVGLLVYPLYTAALILFLDARSRGESPRLRDLLAMSVTLWPRFALLTALNTLLILIGLWMYYLPGLWLMVMLAFAEYLLVLRGLTPLAAMKESLRLTRGHFLRILVCILCVAGPLWVLKGASYAIYPAPQNPAVTLMIDSVHSFLQLFTSVVLFRLFMLISDAPEKTDGGA
ncbi:MULTISPECIES: YciC family protein [unclassified Pseudomonas]|uniref:YciC family protein n=1 Tax=unclassified Pseudomonas TaxID=196821 RepID=UPI002AC9A804|nr:MULTISPECIES: YciC family protein [unclassified Pseudomonas]MEB0044541.1 YciC family protein [Pseudomonas sp. Dout3]MEB0095739.1 YciC family protein [Pseudomonas sp. DC1.2]WPX58213.1 YciC family protein [Pseudomonas sp. DC1.2]